MRKFMGESGLSVSPPSWAGGVDRLVFGSFSLTFGLEGVEPTVEGAFRGFEGKKVRVHMTQKRSISLARVACVYDLHAPSFLINYIY